MTGEKLGLKRTQRGNNVHLPDRGRGHSAGGSGAHPRPLGIFGRQRLGGNREATMRGIIPDGEPVAAITGQLWWPAAKTTLVSCSDQVCVMVSCGDHRRCRQSSCGGLCWPTVVAIVR